jgi:LemA protein
MGLGTDIIFGIGGLFVVAVVLYYIFSIYNGLVTLKNSIGKNWSNIDVLLKQRSDLIPNLVETVEGYMKHEKEAIQMVTDSRVQMMQATTLGDKADAHEGLSTALKSLFALAENYPELKADDTFLKLQEELEGIENEIADRRELYNDCVNLYNTRIQSIPHILFARLMGYSKEEYFKATEDEKKEVEVNLQ